MNKQKDFEGIDHGCKPMDLRHIGPNVIEVRPVQIHSNTNGSLTDERTFAIVSSTLDKGFYTIGQISLSMLNDGLSDLDLSVVKTSSLRTDFKVQHRLTKRNVKIEYEDPTFDPTKIQWYDKAVAWVEDSITMVIENIHDHFCNTAEFNDIFDSDKELFDWWNKDKNKETYYYKFMFHTYFEDSLIEYLQEEGVYFDFYESTPTESYARKCIDIVIHNILIDLKEKNKKY